MNTSEKTKIAASVKSKVCEVGWRLRWKSSGWIRRGLVGLEGRNFHPFAEQGGANQLEKWEDIAQFSRELESLRKEEVEFGKHKVVWKYECYVQAIIHRSLSLIETTREAWNSGNLLGAVIVARALLETAAAYHYFHRRSEIAINASDFRSLDKLIGDRTFVGRWDGDRNAGPNILTLIQRLDKSYFPKEKAVEGLYSTLSELAHPNHYGTAAFFWNIDREGLKTDFSFSDSRIQSSIGTTLQAALAVVSIVLMEIRDGFELLPKIADMSQAERDARGLD